MTFETPTVLINPETLNRADISYYDKSNPRSLVNIIANTKLKKHISNPALRQFLLMDEWRLKFKVAQTPTLNRIRIAFWREFDRSQSRMKVMDIKRVLEGICSSEQFYKLTTNVKNLAWILKPPTSYLDSMEEALHFGIDRMREILEAPIVNKRWVKCYYDEEVDTGETDEDLRPIMRVVQKSKFQEIEEFDNATATLIIKTVALLDQRVRGPLVQKLQIESKHQTIASPNPALPQYTESDLDKKLAELEVELDEDVSKLSKPYTYKENTKLVEMDIKIEEMPHMTDTQQVREDERKRVVKKKRDWKKVNANRTGIPKKDLDDI